MLIFNRAFMGSSCSIFGKERALSRLTAGSVVTSARCLVADERSQRMRSLSAAFTSGLAYKAPST